MCLINCASLCEIWEVQSTYHLLQKVLLKQLSTQDIVLNTAYVNTIKCEICFITGSYFHGQAGSTGIRTKIIDYL